MEQMAIWFFVIGTATDPFPPTKIGPMTELQCTRMEDAMLLPGHCQKAIGMYACEVPGRPGMGTACPILDDEINPKTGGK